MAVTKLGSIKTTLSVAVDYILNPEKTDNKKYVYCFGCMDDGKKAEKEFLSVRSFGTGKGSVLAQHIKQSFKGQEVTPEQALEIGIKTAERLLENKYQYIVATHIDKGNIHNHIIFNNVDFVNFRTFEWQKNRGGKSWEKLRNINDDLCREYNLSIIENPKNQGKCYYEWQQDYLGKSWKSKLRYLIDETIMQSTSFEDFLNKLAGCNIEYKYTPENVIKIKFKLQGQQRFSRGRTLGWYYDEPQLCKRIEQYQLLKTGVSGKSYKTKIIDTSAEIFQNSKGLLHWANIKNMQEAADAINLLTSENYQKLESSATNKYNERMVIVSQLNAKQHQIDELSDTIKLIRTYEKYKPIHKKYLSHKDKKQFKKENITALKKYDDAVKNLLTLYPDRKLPPLDKLEDEKKNLIDEVRKMNERYKQIVAELKEIEFARQSIDDYLNNQKKSHSQDLQ